MLSNSRVSLNNLLIGAAILSLIILLFIYPTRHPDYATRYFQDASNLSDSSAFFFDSIGLQHNQPISKIQINKSSPLVTLFQREIGRHSIKKWIIDEDLQKWPVYHWKTVHGEIIPISFSFNFNDDEPVSITDRISGDYILYHLRSGRVFQYERIVEETVQERLLFKDRIDVLFNNWRDNFVFIPDSLKISADFDQRITRIEQLSQGNTAIFTGRDFYLHFADKYISNTIWSHFQASESPIIKAGTEQPIIVVFEFTPAPFNHSIKVEIGMTVHGTLLSIIPFWETSSKPTYEGAIHYIGYIFYGLVMLAVFIIFLRRYYARLIDFKSCYPDAIFGFFVIFSAIFADALANYIFGDLNTISFVSLSLGGATISGLAVAASFLLLGPTGFSVGHEASKQHLISINFARRGYWFNKPVGRALFLGTIIPTIGAGVVALLAWVFANTPISFNERVLSNSILPFVDDFSRAVSYLIIVYYTIFGIILAGGFSFINRFQKWNHFYIFIFIFFIFWNVPGVVLQNWYLSLVSNLFLALLWLFVLRKYDVFTLFISLFVFIFWFKLLDGFIPFSWFSIHIIVMLPLLICIAGFGYIALRNGADLYDIPDYVPSYIIEHSRRERIERELEIARQVQQNFLPEKAPEILGLDVAARCTPAFEIGGDYYDFIQIDEHKTAVLIGDVSGKGIQAAFYMTLVKGFIRSLCRDIQRPDDLILKVNALFRENVPKGTFITMIYGIFNSENGTFTFVRAGHDPLLIVSDRKIKLCQPKGFPLGMVDNNFFVNNLEIETVTLNYGDAVVLFTDGYTETRNRRGEFFGEKRLEELLIGLHLQSAQEILDKLTNGVNSFRQEEPQHDDITAIVLYRVNKK